VLASGALLFWPGIWWTHAAGLALFLAVVAWSRVTRRRVQAA
jgi:hypothetical protein